MLSTYSSTSVVPGTIHCCCCCIMWYTNKIEATKKCLASHSDLQQQHSSIMLHPSGHPAAGRKRCMHAPIPFRQPRSVCTSTSSLSRACYERACCVLSLCAMRVKISHHHDHSIRQIIFHRETVWGTTVSLNGVHVACSARRSRRGHPRN